MSEGGCLCGQLRYSLKRSPLAVVLCHCRDCQKQSGSAFSVNMIIPEADVEITGHASLFTVKGESGGTVERRFCAHCGSPILSVLGNSPGIVAVKAGTLDAPLTQKPRMQIWTRSAQGWLEHLSGLPAFETGPPAG